MCIAGSGFPTIILLNAGSPSPWEAVMFRFEAYSRENSTRSLDMTPFGLLLPSVIAHSPSFREIEHFSASSCDQ